MVPVQLVHHNHDRTVQLFRQLPGLFRLHFNTGNPTDGQQHVVANTESPTGFREKIAKARSVQQVDFLLVQFKIAGTGGQGDFAFDFFRIVVRNCISVINTGQSIGYTGIMQHGRNQRCLTAVTMSGKCYCSNVFRLIGFHEYSSKAWAFSSTEQFSTRPIKNKLVLI